MLSAGRHCGTGGRVFGLASHLYALRHAGSEGIGDFETLRRFASLTAEIGGRYAGLNPLHHLFPSDRSRASPYQPSDRHYIDPLYISIGKLLARASAAEDGARSPAAAAPPSQRSMRLPLVDYPAVWAAKARCWKPPLRNSAAMPASRLSCARAVTALAAHGRFEALRMGETRNAGPHRLSRLPAMGGRHAAGARPRGTATSIATWHSAAPSTAARSRATRSPSPAGVSIGAPPDPFSAAGQVWNLPPFSPLALDARGDGTDAPRHFRQHAPRSGAAHRPCAGLRAAVLGAAGCRRPRRRLCALSARCADRGDGPRKPAQPLPRRGRRPRHGAGRACATRSSAADILSYRVLWFEREGAGFRRPEAYPAQALACLASHDLPTFFGWRAGRDIEIARRHRRRSTERRQPRARLDAQEEVRLLDELHGACDGR